MDKPHIRRAQIEDAESLTACIDAAYLTYVQRISDLPAVSEGCAEDIATHQVWVATQRGIIIAGMVLVPEEAFLKLANLAVHPDFSGQGVGGALMERAEQEARSQGYTEMRLNTHILIPENVRMYLHMGWTESGRSGNRVSLHKSLL